MTEQEDNDPMDSSPITPLPHLTPQDLDWDQEKAKVRVRQFMNILEQLPRLCSPTICGTLSQPTTRSERASRGADMFEWSMEQKAILSPVNITTDMDRGDDWQHLSELNSTRRQQESDVFFSQRTIAPSPLVTPRCISRPSSHKHNNLVYEEEDEDDEEIDDDHHQARDLSMNKQNFNQSQSSKFLSYEFESSSHLDQIQEENNREAEVDGDQDMDNLFFSPQPLKSSQTQQRMDVFSPDTFVRVMEDENTLQSTPKTTGSSQRIRTRTTTRDDVLE